MIKEIVVNATVEALNTALANNNIAADQIVAVFLIEGPRLGYSGENLESYRVLYHSLKPENRWPTSSR